MIQSDIFTALSTAFSTRLYPLAAPEDVVRPFGVYSRVAANPVTLSGSINSTEMQIDVYANTYAEALTLATSAQTAIAAASTLKSSQIQAVDEYEPETKLYRVILEFTAWHN